DHKSVLVAVRDSGPGIDPSHLERVFDAFYTTKSSGVGMGLSIVDHRRPWGPAVGRGERTSRCRFLVHLARCGQGVSAMKDNADPLFGGVALACSDPSLGEPGIMAQNSCLRD